MAVQDHMWPLANLTLDTKPPLPAVPAHLTRLQVQAVVAQGEPPPRVPGMPHS